MNLTSFQRLLSSQKKKDRYIYEEVQVIKAYFQVTNYMNMQQSTNSENSHTSNKINIIYAVRREGDYLLEGFVESDPSAV